ncbi:MAG: hypothetical protein HKN20_16215, partial [Gemmatimonadetes bacterium]|nr:hypothetical protein [Gemmatimonadota bacterium]
LEEIDIREAVRASIRNLQPVVDQKGLTLTVDIAGEPLAVLSDAETIRLVADNLLDNAAKYTPKGGTIRLRLQRQNGEVVLEVQDDGIGIGTKYLSRIFERFYRVDKARSRELGGTGLGLSIVKNSAIAMGGSVSVVSEPGVGSTFRVCLPVAETANTGSAVAE